MLFSRTFKKWFRKNNAVLVSIKPKDPAWNLVFKYIESKKLLKFCYGVTITMNMKETKVYINTSYLKLFKPEMELDIVDILHKYFSKKTEEEPIPIIKYHKDYKISVHVTDLRLHTENIYNLGE